MDILSKPSKPCCGDEDWIAVGDGKGNMTVVRVSDDCSPKVDITFTWSAGQERQLLGTHWCKPLGYKYDHYSSLTIISNLFSLFQEYKGIYRLLIIAVFII